MTSAVKDCKIVKTILAPDATIVVHHFPVDDATKDAVEESNPITNPETVQNPREQVPHLIKAGGLRCRTCLDVITTQRCYFLMIMGHLTKTIKEMIIFCVPQMASTLSDDDVICYKCLHAIEFCVKFIETCMEVEEKLRNSKSNEIVNISENLEDNESSISCEDVIINDHDYVIKTEPDENLAMLSSSPKNHQPSKSNSDEIGTSTQPNQQILKSPNNVLKSRMFQENLQVQEALQTVTRDCFKCGYCSKSCRTENCLLDHMRRMHKTIQKPTDGDKVVSPTLDQSPSSSDGKEMSTKSTFNKPPYKKRGRNEKHVDDPLIKCPFCAQKLRLSQMEVHLRQHNQGQTEITPSRKRRRVRNQRVLKCKTCLERFSSKDDFKDHLKIHPPYICEQCGKGFIQYCSLVSHKSTHNEPNTFICEFCGKGYRERNVLNVHRKLHENKTFECDKCSKVFKTKLHLRRHIQHVHSSYGAGQCSQCGIIFKTRGSLTSHIRLVHLKLKPFKCEICEREFGRADYLRLHIKVHNKAHREPSASGKKQAKSGRRMRWKIMFPDSSTSSELLPCKFCGKRFQGVPKLKMHLETHVRRYSCQYCPLTFARPQYRTRHELLHNGAENFYRCNICWRRLESEEELEEHVEMTHNNLKYTCHVCGEMFQNTFLLNQHSLWEHTSCPENIENAKQIIYETLLEATRNNET